MFNVNQCWRETQESPDCSYNSYSAKLPDDSLCAHEHLTLCYSYFVLLQLRLFTHRNKYADVCSYSRRPLKELAG